MKIHQLIWPEERIDHIARHGVTPEEVEEVCFDQPLVWLPGHGATDDGQRETTLSPMEKSMKAENLPQTDSIQELAQFWDTHDLKKLHAA